MRCVSSLRFRQSPTALPRGIEPSISIRELGEDHWAGWREVRLSALAEAPEAFSPTFAQWSGIGDAEERWRRRLREVPFNAVAIAGGKSVGMVSAIGPQDARVELISMWVHPHWRGIGAGDALVGAVVEWAGGQDATSVFLTVRTANRHAVSLYRRNLFVEVGPKVGPVDGLEEQRMERRLA